jgi:hypothetical protein
VESVVFPRASSFLLGSLCAFAFGYTLGLFEPTPARAPAPRPAPANDSVQAVGRPGAVERRTAVPKPTPAEPAPPAKRRSRPKTKKRSVPPPPSPTPARRSTVAQELHRDLARLSPADAAGRHELMRAIERAASSLPAEARAPVDACVAKAGLIVDGESAKRRLQDCISKLAKHL